MICAICQTKSDRPERSKVRSNVRAFRTETFALWRCVACRSIHGAAADGTIDLVPYYHRYPYFLQRYDWMSMVLFDNLLRRLVRAGLQKGDRILDYGCGSGHLVRFLHWKGYPRAVGYDAYSPAFHDPTLLTGQYDCVIAQDVLEHVSDPRGLLVQLGALCRTGAMLAIGTPNADAIDLARPEDFVHTLHQPYHLHMLSKQALLSAGEALGWELLRYYPRQYANTLWPGLNQRFALYYGRCFDDTGDLAFDGLRFSLRLFFPWALFLAFFGYFFSFETDVMALFRTGTRRAAAEEAA